MGTYTVEVSDDAKSWKGVLWNQKNTSWNVEEKKLPANTFGQYVRLTFNNSGKQIMLFEADVHDASAVMLYLWPEVNLRLRPRLLAQLRPGARVVSHSHDMGDWKPARTVKVEGRTLHLWVIGEGPAPR